MKKIKIFKKIAAALMLMLSIPFSIALAQTTTTGFSDVPSTDSNYTAIMYLKNRGVISGYPDGTFKPNQVVNRAEALKIILLGSAISVDTRETVPAFKDFKATDWFATFIAKAKALNIVSGYADGTFKPAQTVTLAENLKILLLAQKVDMSGITVTQDPYADAFANQWYAKFVEYAKEKNLIDSDAMNMIYPGQGMTRGKLAQLMYRFMYMKNMGLNSYMQNAPVVPQQQTMETTTSGQTQDPNANLPPASMNVSIQSFSFVKDNMTIAIGTTVRWTNNDTVTHTVTSDNNMFASPDLSPGQSFEYTFNTEGTFTYHCSIHPMMTGTIIVKPAIEVPTI